MLACLLCNSLCTLCLADVPTFVRITHPYRRSLIAGIHPTADGETLFEGYACDYPKATLRSYSSIAPAMLGRYQVGQAYLAAQGHVLVVRYGYGEAGNWQHLSPRERDAGADLATVQKMAGYESVTTAGYDRRGDAARGKAADRVHVPFFPRQA